MKRASLMMAAFVAPLAIAAAPRTASAQVLRWHVGAAVAAGSGCRSLPPADAFFIAFGNQVSVVATSLGVRLPEFLGDMNFTDLKNCQVVIPATLQQGWYIGAISQRLTYGVLKTNESTAELTSVADFFGMATASLTVSIPEGERYSPSTTVRKTTVTGIGSGCAGALQGMVKNNVAIGAERADTNEFIAIGSRPLEAPGLDMKFDTIAGVFRCP